MTFFRNSLIASAFLLAACGERSTESETQRSIRRLSVDSVYENMMELIRAENEKLVKTPESEDQIYIYNVLAKDINLDGSLHSQSSLELYAAFIHNVKTATDLTPYRLDIYKIAYNEGRLSTTKTAESRTGGAWLRTPAFPADQARKWTLVRALDAIAGTDREVKAVSKAEFQAETLYVNFERKALLGFTKKELGVFNEAQRADGEQFFIRNPF